MPFTRTGVHSNGPLGSYGCSPGLQIHFAKFVSTQLMLEISTHPRSFSANSTISFAILHDEAFLTIELCRSLITGLLFVHLVLVFA